MKCLNKDKTKVDANVTHLSHFLSRDNFGKLFQFLWPLQILQEIFDTKCLPCRKIHDIALRVHMLQFYIKMCKTGP